MKIDIAKDFVRYLYTKELSTHTVETYLSAVKSMNKFLINEYQVSCLGDSYNQLKGYMISNWVTSIIRRKPNTRILYLRVAGIFLKYLHAMQYVDFDLSAALPPVPCASKLEALYPEQFSQKRAYTAEEIQMMLTALDPERFHSARTRAIIALLTTTGLRVSELLALKVKDVQPGVTSAFVPRKGTHGNPVEVMIPSAVQPYVKPYLLLRELKGLDCSLDSPLFINSTGKATTRYDVNNSLSALERKLGLPEGVHTFRHTALTNIAKNVDPAAARDVAGQKSISITNHYLHSTREEKLAAVEQLGNLLGAVV